MVYPQIVYTDLNDLTLCPLIVYTDLHRLWLLAIFHGAGESSTRGWRGLAVEPPQPWWDSLA
jgi:hypothetical protein